MSVLRIYKPSECDAAGELLDWECCRMCRGSGKVAAAERSFGEWVDRCPTCDGHGSLKAAALAALAHNHPGEPFSTRGYTLDGMVVRCEDCGHPMSEGTWEGELAPKQTGNPTGAMTIADNLDWARHKLASDREPVYPEGIVSAVHYSPCDEGCRHYGIAFEDNYPIEPTIPLVRPVPEGTDADVQIGGLVDEGYGPFEASWRPVDVRRLWWPQVLLPEALAVLCLRCLAERPVA